MLPVVFWREAVLCGNGLKKYGMACSSKVCLWRFSSAWLKVGRLEPRAARAANHHDSKNEVVVKAFEEN